MAYPLSTEAIVEGNGANPGKIELTDGTEIVGLQCPTTVSSSYTIRLPPTLGITGTIFGLINSVDTDWITASTGNKIWVFTDEKTSGTSGGSLPTGTWVTRDLNTSTLSPDADTSIQLAVSPASTNQLLIQPGTYFVFGFTEVYFTSASKSALWDDDASSILIVGTSEGSTGNESVNSYVIGIITIAVQTVLSYRNYIASSSSVTGGTATGIPSVPEIYTRLSFFAL